MPRRLNTFSCDTVGLRLSGCTWRWRLDDVFGGHYDVRTLLWGIVFSFRYCTETDIRRVDGSYAPATYATVWPLAVDKYIY
jgi:hypothetical protein